MIRIAFYIIFCISLLMVLSLSACQKEDDMHDLSGVVMLELREVCVDGERLIALYAETREQYPCLNFFIDYEVTKELQQRSVHFKGLHVPKICLTAIGPAKAFIELGKMQKGQHPTDILLNEDHVKTFFHLSEDLLHVEIRSDNAESLEFVEYDMHRLSDAYHWGYMQVLQTEPDKNVEDFLEDLWDAGAQAVSLESGNYGFFRIQEDNIILFDDMHQRKVQNPLLFVFDGDIEVLTGLADDYSETLAISFSNPKGEHYHNQH